MPERARPTPSALLQRAKNRVDAAIRWRAGEVAAREVEPTARRAQDLHDWVARVEATAEWTANEMRRLTPQVAAIETRLAELDDRLRDGPPAASDGDRATLELIREEHERVRVRLAAVAHYEERLRRLEDPTDEMPID